MKILCPTDFSKHSKVALEYAVNLTNAIGAELHILGVYQVPKKASSFINIDDTVRENNEEDMKHLLAAIVPLMKSDNLPISHVHRGETVNTILKYAEKKEIDLIVMGTQGSNSLRTLLFGSVTRKVAAKSPIPILAIPEEVSNRLTSNKILLTIDDKSLEQESMFAVPKDLATTLNQKIDVLHISQNKDEFPFDPSIGLYLGDTLGEILLKEGKDPVSEIKEYAEHHDIGLLIMVRREKSFFQRLLTVGNTSEEIARTNIPLMILPDLPS